MVKEKKERKKQSANNLKIIRQQQSEKDRKVEETLQQLDADNDRHDADLGNTTGTAPDGWATYNTLELQEENNNYFKCNKNGELSSTDIGSTAAIDVQSGGGYSGSGGQVNIIQFALLNKQPSLLCFHLTKIEFINEFSDYYLKNKLFRTLIHLGMIPELVKYCYLFQDLSQDDLNIAFLLTARTGKVDVAKYLLGKYSETDPCVGDSMAIYYCSLLGHENFLCYLLTLRGNGTELDLMFGFYGACCYYTGAGAGYYMMQSPEKRATWFKLLNRIVYLPGFDIVEGLALLQNSEDSDRRLMPIARDLIERGDSSRSKENWGLFITAEMVYLLPDEVEKSVSSSTVEALCDIKPHIFTSQVDEDSDIFSCWWNHMEIGEIQQLKNDIIQLIPVQEHPAVKGHAVGNQQENIFRKHMLKHSKIHKKSSYNKLYQKVSEVADALEFGYAEVLFKS
jgi:hypothetical protein